MTGVNSIAFVYTAPFLNNNSGFTLACYARFAIRGGDTRGIIVGPRSVAYVFHRSSARRALCFGQGRLVTTPKRAIICGNSRGFCLRAGRHVPRGGDPNACRLHIHCGNGATIFLCKGGNGGMANHMRWGPVRPTTKRF